jgi:anti-anti-sigma factor
MNVKIDTKEIFHVISLNEEILSANMAEVFKGLITETYKGDNKSIVLNLEGVGEMEQEIVEQIEQIHQELYSNKKSFVLCGLNPTIKSLFQEKDLTDTLNITPTESEAWDIVQMEEIVRELDMDI